jgi:hypothetical protein
VAKTKWGGSHHTTTTTTTQTGATAVERLRQGRSWKSFDRMNAIKLQDYTTALHLVMLDGVLRQQRLRLPLHTRL